MLNFPEWHRVKLNEFLTESSAYSKELLDSLQTLKLLPVLNDMGGCFAIRADGKIVSFLWDNPREIRLENDLRIRNIAIFQGAKRYPELLALISPRTPNAKQCPACTGTGVAPVPEGTPANNFICYCGGLGWVP